MVNEWIYLVLAALLNTGLQFFWKKKLTVKNVDRNTLVLIFVGSFLAAWGMDVIARGLEVITFEHMLKVSLGCWLMFAVSTAAKHYQMNGLSLKQFKIDYGGDLAGFLIMGTLIFALS